MNLSVHPNRMTTFYSTAMPSVASGIQAAPSTGREGGFSYPTVAPASVADYASSLGGGVASFHAEREATEAANTARGRGAPAVIEETTLDGPVELKLDDEARLKDEQARIARITGEAGPAEELRTYVNGVRDEVVGPTEVYMQQDKLRTKTELAKLANEVVVDSRAGVPAEVLTQRLAHLKILEERQGEDATGARGVNRQH